jgi:hypothetical protein
MRPAAFFALILILAGCSSDEPSPRPQSDLDKQLFGPVSMKLDTFSKLKSWTKGANPDGIEAIVEFDDQFGDRTKAAGSIYFELFDYRPGWADPRGDRIVNPWSGSLLTYDDQKAHWDRAIGAYDFQLACDGLEWDKDYVLDATFESADGKRFFARLVLPGIKTKPASPRADNTQSENAIDPTTDPSIRGLGQRYPAP